MEEWQPIETAPKDQDILGYEDRYGIHITWWDDDHDEGAGGWRNAFHGWGPKHWMPLPKPPGAQS